MPHTIAYMQNCRLVAEEPWEGSFSEAQDLAKSAVDSGEYDRAEIRDETGQLKFHYPRALRSA